MGDKLKNTIAKGSLDLKVENSDEGKLTSEMEVDGYGVESLKFDREGDFVFAREGPLDIEESGVSTTRCHAAKRHKSELVILSNIKEDVLSRQDCTDVYKLFKEAVISRDWELAEKMILEADPPARSDFLCFCLTYVWFLWDEPSLDGTSRLIELIISIGACDFRRAALSTSRLAFFFLGSHCVNLEETVTDMDESVQKLFDLALDFMDFHSSRPGNTDGENHNATLDIELRLGVFEMFLEHAGNNLTGKDFTEAFDAACFFLARFSSSFYPGWSYGTAGNVILDFLVTLAESGADNVNQCFLLASCFGSTELVQILLEVADRNEVDVDVDIALYAASLYGKIGTMECLVEEYDATAFLGPLVRAAERGCLPVVEWFVERGCKELEICVALTAATSCSQVQVVTYLLPWVPQEILSILSIPIIEDAGKSEDSLEGVAFLLRSNFVGDPAATYAAADHIAMSKDESVVPKLKSFLQEHWSKRALYEGMEQGKLHSVNMARILKRGESPLQLGNLPAALRVAIAYLPMYKESVALRGCLLSQRLRGQLLHAVWRLENEALVEANQSKELLAAMEHHLRPFL